MNTKNRKTLAAIFANPVSPDVPWADVESLLRALGAQINEGRGSRVRIELNGRLAVFHRPHPAPTTDKGALKSVRRFLESAGVRP
ncbi:type II toxin-antitoxin system HicA family toxin [Alkalidesulfovibrio alkalitolerans]|uniref:type II toxin-antitoxin system HicA family toxin n=1 Tax=Alkalidesulfovibrio alkalitolerans TaxID=293256 RepID=UPI0009FEA7A7|nr:type II toxin-antitoxin system HicA family toxin [Alkalidesulfovibrio alkalitolerans]